MDDVHKYITDRQRHGKFFSALAYQCLFFCFSCFDLAITLSVGDVFMDVIHEYPDLTVHLTLFNATIAEGEPQKLEHNDIQWITPSEIQNYEFCPADEEILAKIIERYGNTV